jgi:hypothetical protein
MPQDNQPKPASSFCAPGAPARAEHDHFKIDNSLSPNQAFTLILSGS